MKTAEGKLTPQQEKAVAALLSFPTVKDAAQEVGISETTLWRWQQEPAFQAAYSRFRKQSVENAMCALQKASGEATVTLLAVMKDTDSPASVRVNAACKILDYGLKIVEWEEIESRLEDMEMRLKEQESMNQSAGTRRW